MVLERDPTRPGTRTRRITVVDEGSKGTGAQSRTRAGETAGFSAERHLHVLSQHVPDFRVDYVVVDSASVPAGREREHLQRAADQFSAEVRYADVADTSPGAAHVHDPAKLADVLAELSSSAAVGDSTQSSLQEQQSEEQRENASWQ